MANEEVPAVSVIIPIYNAEKYIEQCLKSLLNQTLKNFEVIVIDDCSTDNSAKIVEKFMDLQDWQERFSFAQISPNTGRPGIPRNIAIKHAKGKYIYFLDSDDFLDENVLEEFYNVAEKFNADVVHAEKCFKYEEIDGKFENRLHFLESTSATQQPTLETSDIAKRITSFLGLTCTPMIWSKFFRREFLIENDITFPKITVAEDFIFTFQCICLAKKYVRVPFVGYHYRKYDNSTTKKPGTVELSSRNLIEGVDFLDKFMQSQKFFIENPNYQYSVIDFFNQIFSDLIFKYMFFNLNMDTEDTYDFYLKNIFALNPQKNIPLTAYLFVSTNIYKMLVNQQAEEIAQLKKIIAELKGD